MITVKDTGQTLEARAQNKHKTTPGTPEVVFLLVREIRLILV